MTQAADRDLLAEFSNAVAAFLNVMAATADCLEQTHPDVGAPYRQRLHRLRSRVAFDANREAIKKSVSTFESELKDYSGLASRLMTQRGVELKRGILDLSDVIERLASRQEKFSNGVLQAAENLGSMPWPGDPESFLAAQAAQAASLRDMVSRMGRESASMLERVREQMAELDLRLAGATSTDPVTGLVNRRELERQIGAHRLHGSTHVLLVFDIHGPLSDQVLRIAASRLLTKFRHSDWVGRWSEHQFAVLFLGEPDIAQVRAAQAVALLEGRYTLDNGETVLVSAKSHMLHAEHSVA
jgi:GGDEF domain-containing protein